jgi:signal-transduction protein with cAMP-binding, CBS, and nucleotidyltransferase domain
MRELNTLVREVMKTDFPTLQPSDGLFQVHQQMQSSGLDALPVIEDGQFAGLLTSRDVNEAYQLLSLSQELRNQFQSI